jgi:hypothetical protein
VKRDTRSDLRIRFDALLILLLIAGMISVIYANAPFVWQTNMGYLALMRDDMDQARKWFGDSCGISQSRVLGCFRTAVFAGNFAAAQTWAVPASQAVPDMLTLWLAREAESLLEGGAAPAD